MMFRAANISVDFAGDDLGTIIWTRTNGRKLMLRHDDAQWTFRRMWIDDDGAIQMDDGVLGGAYVWYDTREEHYQALIQWLYDKFEPLPHRPWNLGVAHHPATLAERARQAER